VTLRDKVFSTLYYKADCFTRDSRLRLTAKWLGMGKCAILLRSEVDEA